MKVGSVVLFGSLAAVASALAVLAGTNAPVAILAASVAVGASAFLLLGVLDRVVWPSARAASPSRASATRVREAIAAGKHGRRELVMFLDALERSGFGLVPPLLSEEELHHLMTESPEEFRRYLDARVGALERRT